MRQEFEFGRRQPLVRLWDPERGSARNDDCSPPDFTAFPESYDSDLRRRYLSTIAAVGYLHKHTSPRNEGQGLKLQKFHDTYGCHTIESIIQSGNGKQYNASVTENQHKAFVKEPGRTASSTTNR